MEVIVPSNVYELVLFVWILIRISTLVYTFVNYTGVEQNFSVITTPTMQYVCLSLFVLLGGQLDNIHYGVGYILTLAGCMYTYSYLLDLESNGERRFTECSFIGHNLSFIIDCVIVMSLLYINFK